MQNLKIFLLITFTLISIFVCGISISNSVNAIPREFLHNNYSFGPIVGHSENETGIVDWLMTGKWRSSLSNSIDIHNNQSSDAFNSAIEMIKPDGTARHSHTLTDFVIMNISNPDTNSTLYNGTSTISLQDGPAVDIPTTIEKTTDNNVFEIKIAAESINYHFGKFPLYGIRINH